jgi:predicted amidohydrolase
VQGAKLIIIPAEWPLERIEHWRALLVARAIENQAFVVAANSAGKTGNTTFGGHSVVVDPWGKVLVELGESPGMATIEIDLDYADSVRARIPVFDDRRTDVYG